MRDVHQKVSHAKCSIHPECQFRKNKLQVKKSKKATVFPQMLAKKNGQQSVFQKITKRFNRVEVRALLRPVRVLHRKHILMSRIIVKRSVSIIFIHNL